MKTDLESSWLNLSLWSTILQLNSAPLLKIISIYPSLIDDNNIINILSLVVSENCPILEENKYIKVIAQVILHTLYQNS